MFVSTNFDQRSKALGLLTLRLILGFIFMLQGYGKVFTYGVQGVYANFFKPYTEILPDLLVLGTAYYTSYVELIGGFLLLLGFLRFYTYLFLASVLVIVCFGHGLMEPIWDLQHVFYRLAILAALFFLPYKWDRFSLDALFEKK